MPITRGLYSGICQLNIQRIPKIQNIQDIESILSTPLYLRLSVPVLHPNICPVFSFLLYLLKKLKHDQASSDSGFDIYK